MRSLSLYVLGSKSRVSTHDSCVSTYATTATNTCRHQPLQQHKTVAPCLPAGEDSSKQVYCSLLEATGCSYCCWSVVLLVSFKDKIKSWSSLPRVTDRGDVCAVGWPSTCNWHTHTEGETSLHIPQQDTTGSGSRMSSPQV